MKRLATLSACVLAAAAFTTAQAAPTTYVVDGKHTSAWFSYNHLGLTYQTHMFNTISGTVTLDPENTTGQVDATIDANSLNAGSPEFDKVLRSADFFDVAKFPTMTFKSKRVNWVGNAVQSMEGDLTIKGITKPAAFVISNFVCKQHPIYKKEVCGANALAKVSRTAYGMSKYVPSVGDDVTLNIMIEAIKQ